MYLFLQVVISLFVSSLCMYGFHSLCMLLFFTSFVIYVWFLYLCMCLCSVRQFLLGFFHSLFRDVFHFASSLSVSVLSFFLSVCLWLFLYYVCSSFFIKYVVPFVLYVCRYVLISLISSMCLCCSVCICFVPSFVISLCFFHPVFVCFVISLCIYFIIYFVRSSALFFVFRYFRMYLCID